MFVWAVLLVKLGTIIEVMTDQEGNLPYWPVDNIYLGREEVTAFLSNFISGKITLNRVAHFEHEGKFFLPFGLYINSKIRLPSEFKWTKIEDSKQGYQATFGN